MAMSENNQTESPLGARRTLALDQAISAASALGERGVAARLLELLGPALTAAIGNAEDTHVARGWTEGRDCNRSLALRAALLAAAAIAATYEAEGARAWFASTNPNLNGKSPLVFIRSATEQEEFDRVVRVAAQDAR